MAKKEPRIIFFDLETLADLPAVMTHLPRLSDYPGQTLKASINSVICFGYKIGEKGAAKTINAWDFKGWKVNVNDDLDLVKAARAILSTADVVVTHNGKRFDWKFLQTRLMKHGLKPLHKIQHVDTCAVVKQNLYLINNRMNTVAKHLRTHEKLDNGGWELWERVQKREKKAMRLMSKYCAQDVEVLAQIFKHLRPFAPVLKFSCEKCGSFKLRSEGTRTTRKMTYRRLSCKDCGHPNHERVEAP